MPTRRGVAAAVAGLACLAAGWALGYPELDVLGCASLLAVATAVAAVLRRPNVELSREVYPVRVGRGQPAVCALSVRNAARWYLPRVVVDDRVGERITPIELSSLRPGGTAMLSYRLATHRRGVFDVGPLRWHRYDPFGIARSGRTVGDTRRLYVHPVVHPMSVIPSGRARHLDGPAADTAVANSATFHRLREYAPGDDQRQIHWRSSARTGTLMVRESVDTSLPTTTVVLDTAGEAYADSDLFEEAVEVAASAVMAAVRAGFPVRLVTGPTASQSRATRGDAQVLLDQFARLGTGDGVALGALVAPRPVGQVSGVLVVVTGRVRPTDVAPLRRAALRHERAVLAVLRPDAGATASVPPGAFAGGELTLIASSRAADVCLRCRALTRT